MKQISLTFLGIVLIFAIIGALIKTTPIAPPNARMIVDHTPKTYIAPPCFDEAEATNHLEETTFERAIDLGYTPESECTEQAIIGETRSLLNMIFELLGFRTGEWTKDGEWNK